MEVIITDETPKVEVIITDENQEIVLQITDEQPPIQINIEDYHGLSAYELYLLVTTDDPPMTLEEWLESLAGGDISGKANVDASNIDPHIEAWQQKILSGFGEPPEDGEQLSVKLIAEDEIRTISLTTTTPVKIALGTPMGASFELVPTIAGTKISGFLGKNNRFWPGRIFFLWNNSDFDIELVQDEVYVPDPLFQFLTAAEDGVLKSRTWTAVKENAGKFEVLNFAPDIDLSPYALDVDLDAEIVNRAIAITNVQTQITTEKNRNDTQDGQIASKLNNPTTTSDFSMYSNIVAVDDFGNSAKVSSGTIDVLSMFFDWNVKWFFPNPNQTSYNSFRIGTLVQSGAGSVPDFVAPCINYSSSTSTLAWVRGGTFYIKTDYNFIHTRKFTIRTTVDNQRILVGISTLFPTSPPGNGSMSTITNTIGICMDSGSSNLFYIWNNATGAANLQDTGWTNNINYAYELTITGSITSIRIKLMRIHKTTLVKESQFIDITEFQNAFHFPVIYCIDSASTSVVTVGDYGGLLMIKGISV